MEEQQYYRKTFTIINDFVGDFIDNMFKRKKIRASIKDISIQPIHNPNMVANITVICPMSTMKELIAWYFDAEKYKEEMEFEAEFAAEVNSIEKES